MLHDLVNDDGFVALKRSEGQRGMETHRKDVKNLIYSRRLLMMMMIVMPAIYLTMLINQQYASQLQTL